MAHVSKELKSRAQQEIKAIMPKDVKWSLSGVGKGRLSLNVWAAPVDLLEPVREFNRRQAELGWMVPDHLDHSSFRGRSHHDNFGAEWNEIFDKAWKIMNEGNHDRSDVQTDYFDVGWYSEINFGTFDRPFEVLNV